MRHSFLLAYQLITGLSDTGTGLLLYMAPAFALSLMGLHAPSEAYPYVSYIGAFVLSIGMSCLYGARLIARDAPPGRIETVWLLTAFSRGAVAIYVLKGIIAGEFAVPWLTVAAFDTACVVIQAVGMRKRWLVHAR